MTAFNDTFGIIGLSSENVGIDRRIYTGLTSTNPQLNVSYNGGRVDVYLNGVKLMGNHSGQSNYDYTYQNTGSGSAITLSTGVALVATDTIECVGYVSNSSNTVTTYTPSVSAGNNTFTSISHTSSDLLNVFLNGVLLDPSDYTADASADTVAITSLASGDVVHIQVIGALDHSNFVPESGGTFSGDVTVPNLIIGDGGNIGSASDTDALTIDSSGNVGIGTSSLAKTLEVNGQLRIRNGGATGYGLLEYGASSTATNNWHAGSEGDGSFRFYNGNFGAGTERMRIESGGDVKVNTGNLVIGTAGKGISFHNYGTGTGIDSNLLDDYEESSGNVDLFDQPTGGNNLSTATNAGTYKMTKIGNVAHLKLEITMTVNSPSNSAFVTLPITNSTGKMVSGAGTRTFGGHTTENADLIALSCVAGNSRARIQSYDGSNLASQPQYWNVCLTFVGLT